MNSTPTIARYYRGARTVHLERLKYFVAGDFLFFKPLYDFDEALAQSIPTVSRVRFAQVLWRVLRKRYAVLEVAEPYAPSALPQNLMLRIASVASRLSPGNRTTFVTYAIENQDLASKLAAMTRMPAKLFRPLISALVGFCYRGLDRIAFGTSDAIENYRLLLGPRMDVTPPTRTLIWGLPAAEPATALDAAREGIVFLGALDKRKGITQVIASWNSLVSLVPDAHLTVLGKGPLELQVREWAATRSEVTLMIDPSRMDIRSTLARSKALVLLSQPSPLWKEQIGLPIVEGLSFGLEIVASTETGITEWLVENGHRVIDPLSTPETLAHALADAVASPRSAASIASALPQEDGRMSADRWLFDNDAITSSRHRHTAGRDIQQSRRSDDASTVD